MIFVSRNTGYSHNTAIEMILSVTARTRRILLEAMQRRMIKTSIEHLPERYLRDIGLTRNDVTSIRHLPLPFSGARELSQTAGSRAGNW